MVVLPLLAPSLRVEGCCTAQTASQEVFAGAAAMSDLTRLTIVTRIAQLVCVNPRGEMLVAYMIEHAVV